MRRRVLTSLLAVAAVTLAGCSDGSATDRPPATTTATAEARQTPVPRTAITDPPIEQAEVPCDAGRAVVADHNNTEVTVPDCEAVVIDTSNALIHLGRTGTLTVSGTLNGIDATSLSKVVLDGDANRVTTRSEPEVVDNGAANTVRR